MLFPTPFLLLKSYFKTLKIEHNIKIINFIQGTPSFLRIIIEIKNIYFNLEDFLREKFIITFTAIQIILFVVLKE